MTDERDPVDAALARWKADTEGLSPSAATLARLRAGGARRDVDWARWEALRWSARPVCLVAALAAAIGLLFHHRAQQAEARFLLDASAGWEAPL